MTDSDFAAIEAKRSKRIALLLDAADPSGKHI